MRAFLRFLSFVVSDAAINRITRLVLKSQHRGQKPGSEVVGWEGRVEVLTEACSPPPTPVLLLLVVRG